jgi:hypothetical protein
MVKRNPATKESPMFRRLFDQFRAAGLSPEAAFLAALVATR